MKFPITLSGIEPATLRFLAQRLNHCFAPVPIMWIGGCVICGTHVERKKLSDFPIALSMRGARVGAFG